MHILTLSTYPIEPALHGGQHRLLNIVDQFRANGHTTQSVGVLGSSLYSGSKGFVAYPPIREFTRYISNSLLMEDWAIGRLMAEEDAYFSSLVSEIAEPPAVVHVEHPWLFQFARRYVKECTDGSARIVYGAANLEHQLKFRIVDSYVNTKHAELCSKLVLDCEMQAVQGADLIACVSEHDAAWLTSHARCPVILAPNGVRDRQSTAAGISEANKITGHRKTALYCASAHPPNIVGFYDLFGRGVGCLSPADRLVVAGSAGASIKADSRFNRTPGLAKAFIDAGEVTEECLQGLLNTAHLVVLPITQGGGTNLKTAEALWAGHRIVATPVAMRGFESFVGSTGVSVCADPIEFRIAVRNAMTEPPIELSDSERGARRVVLWSETLKGLTSRVAELRT